MVPLTKAALHAICPGSSGPVISHLLFADDSVVFYHAEESEARRMVQLLDMKLGRYFYVLYFII